MATRAWAYSGAAPALILVCRSVASAASMVGLASVNASGGTAPTVICSCGTVTDIGGGEGSAPESSADVAPGSAAAVSPSVAANGDPPDGAMLIASVSPPGTTTSASFQ